MGAAIPVSHQHPGSSPKPGSHAQAVQGNPWLAPLAAFAGCAEAPGRVRGCTFSEAP